MTKAILQTRATRAGMGAALIATLAASGCVVTAMPNGRSKAQWSGTYAANQAKQKNVDRALALRVRETVAKNPQLSSAHLRFFVSHGEVSLCGPFPDRKRRDRLIAVVSSVQGVTGVDEDCQR